MLTCDYEEARARGSDALADARTLGDPVLEAAALGLDAFAHASAAPGPAAAASLERATAAFARLADADLMRRLPGLWMLAAAEAALGRFEAAVELLERAGRMAGATGRELVLVVVSHGLVRPLIELGRVSEAVAAGEEALDRARLNGNAQQLVGAHAALSSARLAAGDVSGALREAEEAVEIDAPPGYHRAGQPAWCLGAALTAAGNPERAVPKLLEALPLVVPADRPAVIADLVEAQPAAGDLAAMHEQAGASSWAAATLARARAAATGAVVAPDEAWATAAPLAAALARLAYGRALAAAGDRPAAVAALTEVEAVLDGFGATRRRDEAVRELRRLGHRVVRAARDGVDGPLGALTAREREIAELVADGRTNREVAEQLVLSAKTIEAHLRNIYAKLGVRSRVELTRRVSVR
jgi:DNA-binding NarL/FixJ family response regulator